MTTTNPAIQLDCSLSVNDTMDRYPATAAVFNAYGIDTCCGGGISVEQAAHDASVDPRRLCAELEEAARIAAA